MAVPKRKVSKARHRKRHAHWKAGVVHTVRCKQCSRQHQPHAACPYCGYYKGREVTTPWVKTDD
ncbi:MAG: 50S ribosomal protein L32 [Fimbriimonadaceae bacterium]|nr:50S ribosomal protein L32 [Fimbriimonadaceae bacterium]